jgi:peptidoglycan/LPS O-acetylase OafA/YrhL
MLRVTLGVAAGFLTMSGMVIATQIGMLHYLFNTSPGVDVDLLPPAYFLSYGVVRLVYAVIGGCICAAIGKKYEAPTILGALMLGTAIGNVVMNRGGEPVWYAALVPLGGAVVATVAGYRWLGRLPDAHRAR